MPEALRVVCPKCRTPYRLKPGTPPGTRVACRRCGGEMTAPEPHPPRPPIGQATVAGTSDDRQVSLTPLECATAGSSSRAEQGKSTVGQADRGTDEAGPPAPAEESVESLLQECREGAGQYIEQGVIARGGMGEIVLCVDRNTRREVAMKRMLTATAADPARRARFVEEAQVTAQLEHPNIVPVHELDHAPDGTIYFTMKLVKGRSLADILTDIKDREGGPPREGMRAACAVARDKNRNHPRPYALRGDEASDAPRPPAPPLPSGEVARRAGEGRQSDALPSLGDLLQMFLKVCDGVAFAHSRGVIHRDLKPANIMVGDFGEVLVMDWGLAKVRGREDIRAADIIETSRLERAETRTIEGSILGTPAYMAPEQAEGKLDKIDERSDIYSLGAILYEILTLERAIQGENKWQVLANVLNGRIVPPEKRAPDRQPPRELSAIAMKCLSKNRARRYRSVLELRKDIGLFLEGRSVSAAPDAFGQAVVKLVKRNKGASLAAAAAAVVLIAVTIGFIIRLEGQRNRALASERRAVLNEQAALAAQQQQRATALKASEGLAQAAIRAADEGRFADADFRANSALQVMPDGPWGHYALGAVASEKKDFAAARKHLDDALKLDPSHQPSKAFLALVLAASGNLAEAEKLAAEADQSKDWRALAAAGDALYAAQRYTRSAKALERAFAMMEKDPTVALPAKTDVKNRAGRSLACAKTEGFYESIRNLPAGDQAARIRAMLKGVYGSDLAFDVTVERGAVTGINFHDGQPGVRWLDPLRSLPLTWLNVSATSVDDLGPLKGMPLTVLGCAHTPVNDLRPLSGMPLARLHISNTRVSDLRPLSGIPLKELQCTFLRVSDLRPLKGMQLTALDCSCCEIADLGPLEGMPLKDLNCAGTFVTDLSPLKGMPLRRLVCWQSMGHRRVRDLGPLTGLPIEELNVQGTYVTDISPLRGMPLKALDCSGSFESGVSDLGPLSGMRLESLKARETSVTDLTPLKGMPLQMLDLAKSKAADLRPLAGMTLKEFWPPAKKQLTPESLKVVEELEKQGCKINWTE